GGLRVPDPARTLGERVLPGAPPRQPALRARPRSPPAAALLLIGHPLPRRPSAAGRPARAAARAPDGDGPAGGAGRPVSRALRASARLRPARHARARARPVPLRRERAVHARPRDRVHERGGRTTFKVTPKGAATESLWLTVLRWQIALALLAVCAAAYQACAQAFQLPGRLSAFAFVVTVFWSVMNAGLIGLAVWWAHEVRHRRRAHRFPVRLQAVFRSRGDEVTLTPATVRDLNPFGLSMRARAAAPVGSTVRVVLSLPAEPLEVSGTVVRSERFADGSTDLGVRFDELPQVKQDAILRWCFSQPFGPDS